MRPSLPGRLPHSLPLPRVLHPEVVHGTHFLLQSLFAGLQFRKAQRGIAELALFRFMGYQALDHIVNSLAGRVLQAFAGSLYAICQHHHSSLLADGPGTRIAERRLLLLSERVSCLSFQMLLVKELYPRRAVMGADEICHDARQVVLSRQGHAVLHMGDDGARAL